VLSKDIKDEEIVKSKHHWTGFVFKHEVQNCQNTEEKMKHKTAELSQRRPRNAPNIWVH